MLKVLDNYNNYINNVASKPESAEIYAIKNEYASVEGGDEVWIRGSKMIGNRKYIGIKPVQDLLIK